MTEYITRQDVEQYKREVLEQTTLVTAATAAAMLACSERTVRRLVREGELHAYCRHLKKSRLPQGMRLLASELRAYVREIKVQPDWWRE